VPAAPSAAAEPEVERQPGKPRTRQVAALLGGLKRASG